MTEETNEFQDYLRLKRGMLKRCLAIVEDPTSKASALAVAMRFLAECEGSRLPPPAVPPNKLPFPAPINAPAQEQAPETPQRKPPPDLERWPFPVAD